MRVYLAQLNPTVGDLKGNLDKLRQATADNPEADLIVFSELFLTGYPPQDLLLNRDFLGKVEESLVCIQEFSRAYPRAVLVFGLPWRESGALYNSAAAVQNGSLLAIQHKRRLTRFRLFDEYRYFSPGAAAAPVRLGNRVLGLALGLELDHNFAEELKEVGADVIINPAALPFEVEADAGERGRFCAAAQKAGLPLLRAGQVGGCDELIFGGGSLAVDARGRVIDAVPDFKVGGKLVNITASGKPEKTVADKTARVYQALKLGLRDYVHKSGLRSVLLGISGGLDSAVAAALASDALGPENVWGVTMPGPFSPTDSVADARQLAQNLRIKLDELPITSLYGEMLAALKGHFAGTEVNTAEENIQARLRGILLMGLSNKFGGLVLTNSNKSELAVGYCTLYGDMSGGLAPLGDVYKTGVYRLAAHINRAREIIPENTILKAPSAELRPGQRDDQFLPPYDLLDAVLEAYLDRGFGQAEIVEMGFPAETVRWVIDAVERSEYKRRQAALILRVTTPVLGSERRMPAAAAKSTKEIE